MAAVAEASPELVLVLARGRRALCTVRMFVAHMSENGIRFKALLDDWPDVGRPYSHRLLTRARSSGVTNGAERNDLTGGNYPTPTEKLHAPSGYQHVGATIEIVGGGTMWSSVLPAFLASRPRSCWRQPTMGV